MLLRSKVLFQQNQYSGTKIVELSPFLFMSIRRLRTDRTLDLSVDPRLLFFDKMISTEHFFLKKKELFQFDKNPFTNNGDRAVDLCHSSSIT